MGDVANYFLLICVLSCTDPVQALAGPSDTPTCPILSVVTYDLRLSALCLPSPWPHGEAGTLGPGEGALGLLGDTFVSHIHSCV